MSLVREAADLYATVHAQRSAMQTRGTTASNLMLAAILCSLHAAAGMPCSSSSKFFPPRPAGSRVRVIRPPTQPAAAALSNAHEQGTADHC